MNTNYFDCKTYGKQSEREKRTFVLVPQLRMKKSYLIITNPLNQRSCLFLFFLDKNGISAHARTLFLRKARDEIMVTMNPIINTVRNIMKNWKKGLPNNSTCLVNSVLLA
jgi:hypothetical protein